MEYPPCSESSDSPDWSKLYSSLWHLFLYYLKKSVSYDMIRFLHVFDGFDNGYFYHNWIQSVIAHLVLSGILTSLCKLFENWFYKFFYGDRKLLNTDDCWYRIIKVTFELFLFQHSVPALTAWRSVHPPPHTTPPPQRLSHGLTPSSTRTPTYRETHPQSPREGTLLLW